MKLEKLEEKVDTLKEDVAELKSDFKSHVATQQIHMDLIKSHIAGDQKIINTIEPLMLELPALVEIVKEYKFEKQRKIKNRETLVVWTKRFSFGAATFALLDWFRKML